VSAIARAAAVRRAVADRWQAAAVVLAGDLIVIGRCRVADPIEAVLGAGIADGHFGAQQVAAQQRLGRRQHFQRRHRQHRRGRARGEPQQRERTPLRVVQTGPQQLGAG